MTSVQSLAGRGIRVSVAEPRMSILFAPFTRLLKPV